MAFRTTTRTEKGRSYYGTHLPQAEIQEDHNKNTTMSQYYSSLKRFVEFYFSSNQDIAPAESERQKNVVLKYCKMNWRRIGRSEDPDREDEAVQILLKIQPIHITRWLNKVAYNSIEPGPQDHPSHARANTLKAHKRALSYYMPRRGETWDWNAARGNPTKSPAISKLIDRVETAENKGHGADACDTRAFTSTEFRLILDRAREKVMTRDKVQCYSHPAFLLLQYHLDARLDDVSLLETSEFRPYPKNSGVLQVSIRSSKNIHKRTDWHWQCITGSMSSHECMLIGLASYVGFFDNEDDLKLYPNRVTERSEGETKKEPTLPGFFRLRASKRWSKASVRNRLKTIISSLKLVGILSTHSVRKFSTETMQNAKVCRDASDQRGRWKTIKVNKKSRASNIYHMSFLRFLDIEACQGLCASGMCRYVVDSLTDALISEIMPATKEVIPGIGRILCAAALWAYKNERNLLPNSLILRIEKVGSQLLPVKRIRIIGDDEDFVDYNQDVHETVTQSEDREIINKIYIEQGSLKRKLDADSEKMWGEFKKLRKGMKQINSRVDRVILYHTNVTSTPSSGQNTEMYNCSSLHEYWLEYEFGINGHKSVKTFSTSEKRKYKDKICLRMKLITAVKLLLPHSPAVLACERLERVYKFDGRKSACLREIGKELKMQPPLPKYFEMYPM